MTFVTFQRLTIILIYFFVVKLKKENDYEKETLYIK